MGRSLQQLALDPTLELLFVSEDGGPLTADLVCPSALRLLLSMCLEDRDSGCEYHSLHSAPRSSAQIRENAELRSECPVAQFRGRMDVDPCHPIMALPIEVQKWSQRLWCLPLSHSSVSAPTGLRSRGGQDSEHAREACPGLPR